MCYIILYYYFLFYNCISKNRGAVCFNRLGEISRGDVGLELFRSLRKFLNHVPFMFCFPIWHYYAVFCQIYIAVKHRVCC